MRTKTKNIPGFTALWQRSGLPLLPCIALLFSCGSESRKVDRTESVVQMILADSGRLILYAGSLKEDTRVHYLEMDDPGGIKKTIDLYRGGQEAEDMSLMVKPTQQSVPLVGLEGLMEELKGEGFSNLAISSLTPREKQRFGVSEIEPPPAMPESPFLPMPKEEEEWVISPGERLLFFELDEKARLTAYTYDNSVKSAKQGIRYAEEKIHSLVDREASLAEKENRKLVLVMKLPEKMGFRDYKTLMQALEKRKFERRVITVP